MAFTKAQRQRIVREYALRNNGVYNPALFLKEVRDTGPDHPAYEWFEWDDDAAATAHRLRQARDFARDLVVKFTVEALGADRKMVVRQVEMPMVLSPISGRSDGGGYYLSEPSDLEHHRELCRQAAQSLRAWLRRYDAALAHVSVGTDRFASAIIALEAVDEPAEDEAA